MDYNPDDLPIRPELYGCATWKEVEGLILESDRKRLLDDIEASPYENAFPQDFSYKSDLFQEDPRVANMPIAFENCNCPPMANKPRKSLYERFLDLFV